jgi:hypothetical protein
MSERKCRITPGWSGLLGDLGGVAKGTGSRTAETLSAVFIGFSNLGEGLFP